MQHVNKWKPLCCKTQEKFAQNQIACSYGPGACTYAFHGCFCDALLYFISLSLSHIIMSAGRILLKIFQFGMVLKRGKCYVSRRCTRV